MKLDISKMDKAEVLSKLYNNARPQGSGRDNGQGAAARVLGIVLLAVLLALIAGPALAQDYPNHQRPLNGPIRVDASLTGVTTSGPTQDIDFGLHDTCIITNEPLCTRRYADRRLIWFRAHGQLEYRFASLATGRGDNPNLTIIGAAAFGPPGSGTVVAYGTETLNGRLRAVSYSKIYRPEGWWGTRPATWKAGTEYVCASYDAWNPTHFTFGPSREVLWFERNLDGSGGIYRSDNCVGAGRRLGVLPLSQCSAAGFTSDPFPRPSGKPGTWRVTGRNCLGELGYWETEDDAYSTIAWVPDNAPPPVDCEDCQTDLAECRVEGAACEERANCQAVAAEVFVAAMALCDAE